MFKLLPCFYCDEDTIGMPSQVAKSSIIGVNLYRYFWGGPRPPPPMSNFNIRPMALHGKNGIRNHKFNIGTYIWGGPWPNNNFKF